MIYQFRWTGLKICYLRKIVSNYSSHLTYFNIWRGGPPGRRTDRPTWQMPGCQTTQSAHEASVMSPNDSAHNRRFSLLSKLHSARDLMKQGAHWTRNSDQCSCSVRFIVCCNWKCYIYFLTQLRYSIISHCAVLTEMPMSLIHCHICPLWMACMGYLWKIPLLTVRYLLLLYLGLRYF